MAVLKKLPFLNCHVILKKLPPLTTKNVREIVRKRHLLLTNVRQLRGTKKKKKTEEKKQPRRKSATAVLIQTAGLSPLRPPRRRKRGGTISTKATSTALIAVAHRLQPSGSIGVVFFMAGGGVSQPGPPDLLCPARTCSAAPLTFPRVILFVLMRISTV